MSVRGILPAINIIGAMTMIYFTVRLGFGGFYAESLKTILVFIFFSLYFFSGVGLVYNKMRIDLKSNMKAILFGSLIILIHELILVVFF